jgi:hypothetical protein
MPEERTSDEVQVGERVYRYACTEEIEIGGTVWLRDRYKNINGDKNSFLLLNFENTNIPVGMTPEMMQEPIYFPEPEPAPKPKREPTDYRQYIQEWKEKGLVK